MGRNKKKVLRDFIDDIPDDILEGFPDLQQTLYEDINFRLDMQGVGFRGSEFFLQRLILDPDHEQR